MQSALPIRDLKLDTEGRPTSLDSVLIAEDDPIFRHLLDSWLQRWQYRVTAVDNGMDAWNVLQQANAPQMAILDWMMPGMDGAELCRRVRSQERGPYRYLLLLTAKHEKQDVVAGLDAGADDYLTKPFDVDELRARVRSGKRILDLQHALLRAQEALQYEAAHDPLTGLWNRGAIMDLLRRETQRHQRTGSALGVIMADLDHFKQINDTHGHLVGDAVLQEVSRRLIASVRIYDFIGRYGGEEFLMVIPSCNSADLQVGAERLRRAIADTPIATPAGPINSTISIGVASAPMADEATSELEALLRVSDEALYLAKANGRNRVEIAIASRAASAGV
jgi:two-component system cell cycle response regulator